MSALSDITTFARTGTATFVDSDGVLQTAATGVPRTAHHLWDGSAWVNAGLLLESEARTNLFTFSEAFDNAAWTKIGSITVTSGSTGPDGLSSAFTIEKTATGESYTEEAVGSLPNDNASYCTSVFVAKTTPANYVGFVHALTGGSSPIDSRLIVNTADGQISATSGNTPVFAKVVGFGGYWRICLAVQNNSTGNTVSRTRIYPIYNDDGSATQNNTLTGSAVFFGAQLEAASTPSSYIPTTGTTATRNAETLTIDAADAPWSGTAVSIQMEGTVTYADTDSAEEVLFLEWQLTASNEIYTSLQTNGARTGRLLFAQLAGGVGDFSTSGDTAYTPGINVPFNIASRHGTTFINGAVDGTALTANLTPTALPDLSATDVKIGTDFMGTIKLFRIWADDIGDVGIASAST